MIRLAVALGLSMVAYNLLRFAAQMNAPKQRCIVCGAEMNDLLREECEWHWRQGEP